MPAISRATAGFSAIIAIFIFVNFSFALI